MFEIVKNLIRNRYLPRWVVLAFDMMIVILAFFLAYNLRYSLMSPSVKYSPFLNHGLYKYRFFS